VLSVLPGLLTDSVDSLASGYTSRHIVSQSAGTEIWRVVAGWGSSLKHLGLHGWAYSHSHLCGCCRSASGHTVRGVSERGPVINQGSHQILN